MREGSAGGDVRIPAGAERAGRLRGRARADGRGRGGARAPGGPTPTWPSPCAVGRPTSVAAPIAPVLPAPRRPARRVLPGARLPAAGRGLRAGSRRAPLRPAALPEAPTAYVPEQVVRRRRHPSRPAPAAFAGDGRARRRDGDVGRSSPSRRPTESAYQPRLDRGRRRRRRHQPQRPADARARHRRLRPAPHRPAPARRSGSTAS